MGKVLVGRQTRVAIALACGRLARRQKTRRLVGQNGHAHVQQRHVDVLALAGAVAHVQRRQDGAAGMRHP